MLWCQCPSVRLSVCLSVTEVHWRVIANLGFKFRSHFTAVLLAVLLAGGSSRAMLASARLSCITSFQEGCEILWWLCLFVCFFFLSARKLHSRSSPVTCAVTWGHGPDVRWRRCIKYFRFCGWHHVFIAWSQWRESSVTLYFDKVHQVAVPVGRQTTNAWLCSSECGSEGEVCYLRYPCCISNITLKKFL